MNYFTINQKLPSLNEYIGACRANQYLAAKFKKEVEQQIIFFIRQAQTIGTIYTPSKPIILNIEWHERTIRRDADNIVSAKKFILDAMVKAKIIQDDNRHYVKGFNDRIIDDKKDYVKVELIEIN